ncbi:MAG: helix-turn-helix domain-containing protein [Bradyrhizobium sp.]
MPSSPLLVDLAWRPVAPDLRPFVTAYVERRDVVAFAMMRELPVPVPLVQIMLGPDLYFATDSGPKPVPRAALWGPSSTAPTSHSGGPLHVLVAVLTLRGAAVLGRPAEGCLADRQTPLDPILPSVSRRLLARVHDAPDCNNRVVAMENWLREVFRCADPPDAATAMIDAMLDHKLRGPVSRLAQAAGISERALHKRCERLIGWPPKKLLRIARLQRVLSALHPSPWLIHTDPCEALLEHADDAHLAHDFKNLTGLTVSAYRKAKLASGDRLVHTLIET